MNISSWDAVEAALDNILEARRLCPSILSTILMEVPSTMLRLGRDQDAYDYIKGYCIGADKHPLERVAKPSEDVKDADAFEVINRWMLEEIEPPMLIALVLIKLKMMVDLENLRNFKAVAQSFARSKKLPTEMVEAIKGFIPESPIIASNKKILDMADQQRSALETKLGDMFYAAWEQVHPENTYFWSMLLAPRKYASQYSPTREGSGIEGSVEEARLFVTMV